MVVIELKCQMCGARFEAEALDQQDPNERDRPGDPIHCPKCRSTEIEVVRRVRQAGPARRNRPR